MIGWINTRLRYLRLFACLAFVAAVGCGYIPSKRCCPVYLPHDHLLGSEAVRRAPCGPDCQFYGLQRTIWREWPVEWQFQQSSTFTGPHMMEPVPYEDSSAVPGQTDTPNQVKPNPEAGPNRSDGTQPYEEPPAPALPKELFGPPSTERVPENDNGAIEFDSSDLDMSFGPDGPIQPLDSTGPGASSAPANRDAGGGAIRPSAWTYEDQGFEESSVYGPQPPSLPSGAFRIPSPWSTSTPRQVNRRAPRPSKFRR